MLIQNYTDIGVLTNIDGTIYDEALPGPVVNAGVDSRPHGKMTAVATQEGDGLTDYDIKLLVSGGVGVSIDQIIMGASAHTNEDIEVESLLQTLRNKKKYTDDKDNVLPGDFLKFEGSPGGKMFKCTKTGGEWVMSEESSSGLINGDGRTSEECKDTTYYRTITTCAAGIRIAETEEEENTTATTGVYHFLVKYDNSENAPMAKPYKVGNTANVYLVDSAESLYRGDFVVDLTADSRTLKVKYVVGGYFTGDEKGNYMEWAHQESGDVYYELYGFLPVGIPDFKGDFRTNQDNEHKLVYTDKEAAKAIMEKYGYGPNNTLKLEYYYNQNAMHDTVSAVIKEQLKDIYVDVTLKTAELRTFFDDRSYGRYDLARNAFSADYMDPWNYLELMAIYNDPEGRTFFGDETYDKLLFESMELEGEARFAKLHEAETYAIETMCFNVPLFGYGSVSLQKPGTTGVINNPQANHIFWFVKCPE